MKMEPYFKQDIVTIGPGRFSELVEQLERVYTASQIQTDRLNDETLRCIGLITGDGAIYGLEGDDVFLYLTNPENNPALNNPEEFESQLRTSHNFLIGPTQAVSLEAIAKIGNQGIVPFNLSSLERKGALKNDKSKEGEEGRETAYIDIVVRDLLNRKDGFQKKYGKGITMLVEHLCGSMDDEDGIGSLLTRMGWGTIKLYTLAPSYVRETLEMKEPVTMLARATYVHHLRGDPYISLADRTAIQGDVYLRGLKESEIDYEAIAKLVTHRRFDPRKLGEVLSPIGARRLFQAVTAYQRKQMGG